MNLKRPYYEGQPIGSVAALARALGIHQSRLRRMAARADRLYRGPIVIRRPGRSPRAVYSASPLLRDIHERILDRILRRVRYPDYLMGGLEGRSYVDNARLHTRSRTLFGQDVDAFYPSIPKERVVRIFLDVFHFVPEVAALLAQLTTRHGALVQGGVASTHLANLALYRTEPGLEWQMRAAGFTYSRFVDDVHVSSRRVLSPETRTRWRNAFLPRTAGLPTEAQQAVRGDAGKPHPRTRAQRKRFTLCPVAKKATAAHGGISARTMGADAAVGPHVGTGLFASQCAGWTATADQP